MEKLKDILTILTFKKLSKIIWLAESHLIMVRNEKRPLSKWLVNRIDKIKEEVVDESKHFKLIIKAKDEEK